MKYVIFSDSACDLTKKELKRYGIWPDLFTQGITCNSKNVSYSNVEAFYERFDEGLYPPDSLKTASSGDDEIRKLLSRIVKKTDPDEIIVYAGISQHMSSTTSMIVRTTMTEFAEKHPDRKFIFIETHCVSNGLATFLEYLAKYDGDDIEGYAEELGKHIMHLFTLRDLSYAMRSGRFSLAERVKSMIAGLMKISPWMYAPYDGQLNASGRGYRGDLLLHEWVNYYIEHVAEDNEFVRIGYGSESEHERANKLIRMLKEKAGLTDEQIQLARVSPVVCAHTGSTVLSFFFKQKDERC